MKHKMGVLGTTCAAMLLCLAATAQAAHTRKTENVVLIVTDGLRWQEVFSGAEQLLLNPDGGNWSDETELKKLWWSDDPAQRRQRLMPFVWGTMARDGQLYGNQLKGSVAKVSNDKAFSYPGYNEMNTGFPDPKIDSNQFGPNPNKTVFEWLNAKPAFKGKVAVFGTWDAYHDIFNVKRSQLPMQAGWDMPRKTGMPFNDATIESLFKNTTRFDREDLPNSLLHVTLIDYVKRERPRVLFVGYGETDNWAHQGRYDVVLDAANRTDGMVRDLWNTMQAMPQYRGKTTFIFTCDHGRGSGKTEWRDHGVDEKGSENIWIAVMGPDTPALGERHDTQPVKQAQIAATIAALLGEDYVGAVPAAAPPLAEVLPAAH
jgi:hypothetical protein